MIMNTSTAYYSGAESISNKKFANNQARRHTLYIKDPETEVTVSSSAIRGLLQEGNVSEAAEYLGYDFFLDGTVVGGYVVAFLILV